MSVPSAGVGANWHSGVRGRKRIGVEQEEQVRVRIVVACVLSRGRWDRIVPSALLLASELGRGERQDLALQACRSYWTWEGKNSFKM